MNSLDKKVSISIVNFNTGQYLTKCLRSLEKCRSEANMEIWVSDNGSRDGSLALAKKHFPNINYVLHPKNLGFAKAHNIVLRKIKNPYILILNPDTEIERGTLSFMLNFMEENPQIGAASCKIVLPDGSLDFASHRGFPTPLASFLYFLGNDTLYHLTSRDMNKIHQVDAISGSFFLTKKEVLDKVGLFDEDFFLYAEDIDLCFRIKQASFKVMFVPDVAILHYKGISSGLKKHSQDLTRADQETRMRSLNAFYETMKIFYKKHLQKRYPSFVNWLVYGGINLRWWLAKRSLSV